MNEIPLYLLEKYNMYTFKEAMERHPEEEETFYQTFLLQTDYIPAKMMEAQLSGETLEEDYSDVLEARKFCREQISALRDANNIDKTIKDINNINEDSEINENEV